MTKVDDPAVLLFGGVLWDVLPQGNFLGGAPLNVAWNLHALGVPVRIMSSLGDDALGQAAREKLLAAGMNLDLMQTTVEGLPTGTAEVRLDEDGVPTFRLAEPVAYDDILPSPEAAEALASVKILYYGTKAVRRPTTRRTLAWLWDMAPEVTRFCDLNLRAPFYTRQVVAAALSHADVLKINEDELAEIAKLGLLPDVAGDPREDLPAALQALGRAHGLGVIYLTRGPDPLLVWDELQCPRVAEVAVPAPFEPEPGADTIGAGDGFSAGCIQGLVEGWEWRAVVERGLKVAAAVCAIPGAQGRLEEIRRRVAG
jgi:fructokinase